ncbi:uncharacterized protein V1510DRAFT_424514 [Dipodascopsis tothii]|uniref:uncharacterized protein n=1 Tax=Dipodascopsis tothii TaxID=44089 RepID=UPI0034CEFF3E
MIQQSLLNANSSTLHDKIFRLLDETASDSPEYYIELARSCLSYSYDSRAQRALTLAVKAASFSFVLTGVKAVRTKYQTRAISHLVGTSEHEISMNSVPSNVKLESDLLLETPTYNVVGDGDRSFDTSASQLISYRETQPIPPELEDEDPNAPSRLSDLENCILLMTEQVLKATSPYNDPLTNQQLMAYVSRIIANPQGSVNWTIFSRSLWERSMLESNSAKTVERGLLQMATLVEDLGADATKSTSPHAVDATDDYHHRLKYIHCLPLIPRWKLDLSLASQYISLGLVKSAQEIYYRLKLPIELALCTAAGGNAAEAIADLKLYLGTPEGANSGRAWSVLGDITQEPEYWLKAWEIAKYPAAKRSLGEYFFNKGEMTACMNHLKDSLRVNPLNKTAWFLYGCAGLEAENYEAAAEAFTRCVSQDEEDAKSWANLSTALLKGDAKTKEAMNALSHACRLNPDDWRIWSNYVIVSAKVENWAECLRATSQLIKLRSEKDGEAAIDIGVLKMLSHVLVTETEYPPVTFFQKSAVCLFTEQVPLLITRNPELWLLVSRIYQWLRQPWEALASYEKAFRMTLSTFDANPISKESWSSAVEACVQLVDAYINYGPMDGPKDAKTTVCADWRYKAKSSIRSLMSKGKRLFEDTEGWDRLLVARDEL